MPSTSCPNLTYTPDSVLWNQIAQNSQHLNNNNNMPNRNTNYTTNSKAQYEQGNSNSLFWSTTASTAPQSYHSHPHANTQQPTTAQATGNYNSGIFSSSISSMLPSNMAENYEFGIDSGMRELKMRFESDLEEHDKQWEQRSSSSNANNQLYSSSIHQ